MNGTITTWFKDKGFGFIKDENGDNRYFHVIKVANPDLIKKDADSRIDKENTVLSVGILMNNIKPKSAAKPDEMRTLKKLAITTFQGETLIFSEDEIDVDATVKLLKV